MTDSNTNTEKKAKKPAKETVVSDAPPATYAVIRTGGKQYRVSPGSKVSVEKLEGAVGDEVVFSDVLLVKSSDKIVVGAPLVDGASVKAKILAQEKDKKVLIYKKRRRKGYTKKQGHRQARTRLVIESL